MTNIDQFESVFKAADKTPLNLETVRFSAPLVLSGLGATDSDAFQTVARDFLQSLPGQDHFRWSHMIDSQLESIEGLVKQLHEVNPDLICTYRNLMNPAPDYPYSLGVFVDVLTQITDIPVLLLPTPVRLARHDRPLMRRQVMAITDHLAGDHHLVSCAAYFTEPGGTLFLSHVEDQLYFDRFLEAISKIPEIDTEVARETISEQLLKEPTEFVNSCRDVLAASGLDLNVEAIVTMGHQLTDYKYLIQKHEIELLVLNTKDDDQLAMHGVAYPLTVELRDTPLLLL